MALFVAALLLRYGSGAESLAWSILLALTPFSAVFYPIAVLPAGVRWIAEAIPAAHVFEGMRGAMADGPVTAELALAAGLNVLWATAACAVFAEQFSVARRKGQILTVGE